MKTNSWQNVTLICANHGTDYSNQMELISGPHSLFYKCPCYKSIYGNDHSGRSCNNRLDLVKFEKMLDRIDKESQSNPIETMNITGVSWKQDGVEFTVLEQNDEKFKIAMLNKRGMAR